MKTRFPHRLLESPRFFKIAMALLAPGARPRIASRVRAWLGRASPPRRLLDVGCGPKSWLEGLGLAPVGVDVSLSCAAAFRRQGGASVVADAASLPFRDGAFDLVGSFGLLHHLSESHAREAVGEMRRVLSPDGEAVVLDAVLPEPPWRRPVAWCVRRLDRGRWHRSESDLRKCLGEPDWRAERFTYALTGLEGLFCTSRKAAV